MDEPTNGKSSLRLVTPFKQSHRTKRPLSPKTEKQRRHRIKRRREFLTELWRICVSTSIAGSLGIVLLQNGWAPINSSQINVIGSPKLKGESIVQASGLKFPMPLLAINPKRLKTKLLRELPVKAVSIRRHLFPPLLEIELKERKPIAFAQKNSPKGKLAGMIDKEGYWMPIRVARQAQQPEKALYVEGWIESHRPWVSKILKNRNNLGSSLIKIVISPNGEISLQTKRFQMIHLGSNTEQLDNQMKALDHLSSQLPLDFFNQVDTTIDLRDPTKPEVQIPTRTK